MRMWMIDPVLLCKKHLIGEHGELHKFLPSFRKGHKVDGRFSPIVQIQFKGYLERHDALAQEMLNRGYNHKSPLVDIPDFARIYPAFIDRMVEPDTSIADLMMRCENCNQRIFERLF